MVTSFGSLPAVVTVLAGAPACVQKAPGACPAGSRVEDTLAGHSGDAAGSVLVEPLCPPEGSSENSHFSVSPLLGRVRGPVPDSWGRERLGVIALFVCLRLCCSVGLK